MHTLAFSTVSTASLEKVMFPLLCVSVFVSIYAQMIHSVMKISTKQVDWAGSETGKVCTL